MKKYTLMNRMLLLVFILIPSFCISQSNDAKNFVPKVEWHGYMGQLLIHREAMEGMKVQKPYMGQELRLGVQTTGENYWEEVFKYPTYGMGFYSGYFNNEIIGNPFAVYGFIEFPFVRKVKHYWSTSWSFGVGFNVNEYNEITNPENVAIATDVNVYGALNTVYKYHVNKRLDIGAGINVQHLSNGAYKHPNLGLNLLSAEVILAYKPAQVVEQYRKPEPKAHARLYEFTTMYAGGLSSVSKEQPTLYYNSVLSVNASKFINYKRTAGVGFDIFYNEFLKTNEAIGEEASTSNLMSYAGFLSTDLVASRFRMSVQLGFYLWRKTNYDLPFYERVAFRYYFLPNMFGNVSIKAHAFKAQYLEWGIGITI